jgi:hypothetical protein
MARSLPRHREIPLRYPSYLKRTCRNDAKMLPSHTIRRSCGRRAAERRRRACYEPPQYNVGTRWRGHSGVSIACHSKPYNFQAPQVMEQPFRASTTASGRRLAQGRCPLPLPFPHRSGRGKTGKRLGCRAQRNGKAPLLVGEGLGWRLRYWTRVTGPDAAGPMACRSRSASPARSIAPSARSCGHRTYPASQSPRSWRRQTDRQTLPSRRRAAESPTG